MDISNIMMAMVMKPGDPASGGVTEAKESTLNRNPQAEKMRVLMDYATNMVARKDIGGQMDPGRQEQVGLVYNEIAKHWGETGARKLITQINLFNQDPAFKNLPPEDRVRAFSMLKTGDSELDNMLGTMRSGYGADSHLRNSAYKDNAVLTGRVPAEEPGALSTGAIQALMANDKFKDFQAKIK